MIEYAESVTFSPVSAGMTKVSLRERFLMVNLDSRSVFVFVNLQSKYVDEDRRGNVVPDKECGNSSYLDVIPERVKVSVKVCKKGLCF